MKLAVGKARPVVAFSPQTQNNIFPCLFCLVVIFRVIVMAELHQIASTSDLYLVFDGRKLHKKAFSRKGKLTIDNAALVAGVLPAQLLPAHADHIIKRMVNVKKVFQSRVQHFAQNSCVENARKIGMIMRRDGGLVQSYTDIVEELESNCTMENFQNWYNIYYKEFEVKSNGKKDAETRIMQDLNIMYHDNTTNGGCVGKMLSEVLSKLLENIQKQSRDKQRLHLTKSRPGTSVGNS